MSVGEVDLFVGEFSEVAVMVDDTDAVDEVADFAEGSAGIHAHRPAERCWDACDTVEARQALTCGPLHEFE